MPVSQSPNNFICCFLLQQCWRTVGKKGVWVWGGPLCLQRRACDIDLLIKRRNGTANLKCKACVLLPLPRTMKDLGRSWFTHWISPLHYCCDYNYSLVLIRGVLIKIHNDFIKETISTESNNEAEGKWMLHSHSPNRLPFCLIFLWDIGCESPT